MDIKEAIDRLEIPGDLIYICQYGSHLYGLNTENSDLDLRGVYLPRKEDMLIGKYEDEFNTEINIEMETYHESNKTINGFPLKGFVTTKQVKADVKLFSLHKFIKLCSKGDTNALDLLFSWNMDHSGIFWWAATPYFSNVIGYMYDNRHKLIDTDKLESPCRYAFKQATKYGLKGQRLKVLQGILNDVETYMSLSTTKEDALLSTFLRDFTYEDLTPVINDYLDDKHVKIELLDNKGTLEHYLNVCGVQHQYNLSLKTFKQRIQDKIDKEYTSQRTKDAQDGNDWKALSHALRILFEIEELLTDKTITFPCKEKQFLLDVKQGKVDRSQIDDLFNDKFNTILDKVNSNVLEWKYDEQLWNDVILTCYCGLKL